MSARASQITVNSTVLSTACSGYQQRKQQHPHITGPRRENLSQRASIVEAFPCHDVIMFFFVGMLPTKESRLPLDNEHFKTIVMGTGKYKSKYRKLFREIHLKMVYILVQK